MQNVSFEEVVERIVARDGRYHPEAYEFVREGLEYTQQMVAGETTEERHVTGQQLVVGLRDYALREFGPMAITVLHYWGITRCGDFGDLVFNLIDEKFLRKTESDAREDFQGAYEFEEAFVTPFLPASRRSSQRPASPSPVKPGGT